MKNGTLRDLLLDQLRDMYNMENQLVKTLPKMAEAANSGDLSAAFEEHLEQTRGHVQRLEQIFDGLGQPSRGKKCVGMEGIIEEGKELLEQDLDPATLDAGIIGAAQKVEHYEIAAYGTARTHAELLGLDDAVRLLEQTLAEEKETDQKLTDLAQQEVNPDAEASSELTDEDEASIVSGNGQRSRSRTKVGTRG